MCCSIDLLTKVICSSKPIIVALPDGTNFVGDLLTSFCVNAPAQIGRVERKQKQILSIAKSLRFHETIFLLFLTQSHTPAVTDPVHDWLTKYSSPFVFLTTETLLSLRHKVLHLSQHNLPWINIHILYLLHNTFVFEPYNFTPLTTQPPMDQHTFFTYCTTILTSIS